MFKGEVASSFSKMFNPYHNDIWLTTKLMQNRKKYCVTRGIRIRYNRVVYNRFTFDTHKNEAQVFIPRMIIFEQA